jgi:glycosyltransferase involved in cell wall biosynthesis
LEKLRDRLNLHDSIRFYGRKPNQKVQQMMLGANMYVMPSITEGFGLVYAEAMAAGIPVIATAEGGFKEVFRPEKEVLFARPEDPQELARLIRRLVTDENLAAVLSNNGREAVKRLSVNKMARDTEAIFLDLIKAKKNNDRVYPESGQP